MTELYQQWPSGTYPPSESANSSAKERDYIHDEVENYFSQLLGYPVLVMSSGQAAISVALKYYAANRSQIIFGPKWSSHCVWSVLGAYSNLTCVEPEEADIVLAVHKYGAVERFRSRKAQIIIEDSCDSLFVDGETLFPNGGDFEVVSLPKVMGIYSGALLVCRTEELYEALKPLSREFNEFNARAGLVRYLGLCGDHKNLHDPNALEYKNFSHDYRVLKTILDNLDKIQKNQELILKRIDYIARGAPALLAHGKTVNPKRLPPVIPLPVEDGIFEGMVVRHVSTTSNLSCPSFVKCALIPLHAGVDDQLFVKIISELQNYYCE